MISTPSRRWVAGPDRRAPTTRRRSRRSGRVMPASTGTRPPTRSRAPITCRCHESNRLLALLNIAMADTAITIWSAKRYYGGMPTEVTWRPATSIPLADTDGNPDTAPDAAWQPLVNTPCHPEYPAGHPSLNGAAATVLLSHFDDDQTFTLTTAGLPSRTYTSIAQARCGREQRPGLGRHALSQHRRDQRRHGRGDRQLRQSEFDAAPR